MAIADDTVLLLDARGYPRAGGNLPGAHKGRTPRNKGQKYEPTPPSNDDIVRCCQVAPKTAAGLRDVALIVMLWRTGMRIGCEALRLHEHDLDAEHGTIRIRRGKGNKARTVAMDPWAWREVQPWLEMRRNYPAGPLYCVVEGPTRGRRPVNQHQINLRFRDLADRAGVRQRFAPHQLRHRFTLDQLRRNIPAHELMQLLGHANLKVTTTYTMGLDREAMYDGIRNLPAPLMAVPRLIPE